MKKTTACAILKYVGVVMTWQCGGKTSHPACPVSQVMEHMGKSNKNAIEESSGEIPVL